MNKNNKLWIGILVVAFLVTTPVMGNNGNINTRLDEGLNELIITSPLEDVTLPNVLASIEGKYNSVWYFDGTTWLSFNPDKPNFLNTLHEIPICETFFITMDEPGKLKIKKKNG